MKTAINMQSQNEVKDLLNEYVVSPLNTGISSTLSQMEKEIESLEESTKADISKIFPSINGKISRLQSLLDRSFHFDDEEDVFENISNALEDSQENIVKKIDDSQKSLVDTYTQINTILSQLKLDFENADERINDTFKNNKDELLLNASGYFNKLCELINNLRATHETSTNGIKDALSEYQYLTSDKINSLSALTKESFEQVDKKSTDIQHSLISELHEVEKILNEKRYGLTNQLDTTLQTVSTSFDEQNSVLSSYHEETKAKIQTMDSQRKEAIEQKYKKLFAVSLSFGIANTIGVITMIVLYLLK